MKVRIALAVLPLLFGACSVEVNTESGDAGPEVEEQLTAEDNGDFVVVYDEAPEFDEQSALLIQNSEIVDQLAADLNEQLALPSDITINMTATAEDDPGPYFDPEADTIYVSYGSLDIFGEALAVSDVYEEDELVEKAIGVLGFVVGHEVGHALVDVLELPVTGKEEDAVDGFAAVLMSLYDEGGETILAAADAFDGFNQASGDTLEYEAFADEHSLDLQRAISLKCLVYGSDPENYEFLVENEELPASRAERCGEEFDQAYNSWETLLSDWLVNQEAS